MRRSRSSSNRRVFTLCGGLTAVGLGLGAVVASVVWDHLPLEVGAYFFAVLCCVGGFGALWWHQIASEEAVDEAAPRTIRYVYMPPKPEPRWSTVYTPRSHPLEDGLTTRMWADLVDHTGNTGEIVRPR